MGELIKWVNKHLYLTVVLQLLTYIGLLVAVAAATNSFGWYLVISLIGAVLLVLSTGIVLVIGLLAKWFDE